MKGLAITTVFVIAIIVVWNLIVDRHYERRSTAEVVDVVSYRKLDQPPMYMIYYQKPAGDTYIVHSDMPAKPGDRIEYSTSPEGMTFRIL